MKRSKFSLSNYKLFSCDMGELVPIGLTEVLPGDTIQHATSALVRCSPLLSPIMHPVTVRIHHWYVPHRLIWDDFEDFITGGPDGFNASVFPTITLNATTAAVGTLADYLGVPTGLASLTVSALPFRAYNLIYNEWYRDQDLMPAANVRTLSGADTVTSTTLRRPAWEKDYFTSARPWEQKGPAITIPLGTQAPVLGIGTQNTAPGSIPANTFFQGNNVALSGTGAALWDNLGQNQAYLKTTAGTNRPEIFADLTNASAVTVNVLREALALQRYEEARARYGSRYVEYLRYLNVRSSDARLDRPEYLGGGKQTIQFSEVLQTAQGTSPVGEMRGHGIGAMRSNRYRRFFEEHGYIISMMSIRPKTIYVQGLPRTWNRRTKEDFWQRELQHIGQQEILNKELYAAHTTPDGIFGFQDRYDEYRRQESSVGGEFRTTTLDYWHMARIFASNPALNASFVECLPTKRVFASQATDGLYVMANHNIQARRLVAGSGKSFIY
ncbi:MAG: major capsid protein [Arizlama microvirus]|nr:MAG: major capsid protein [Arizlama microvirus]